MKEHTVLGRKIPPYLYKYRCSNKYTNDLLSSSKLYLGPSENLNDPYDCQVGRGLDLLKQISVMTGRNNEFRNLETMRVTCFSENCDNHLMWAHYADCHKGMCIRFSTGYPTFRRLCWPVTYSEKPPNLINPRLDECGVSNYAIVDLLTTKSKGWEYEREWRVLSHCSYDAPDDPVWIQLEEGVIDAVIFGVKMPQYEREGISHLVNDQVQLFEAELKRDGYGIDIRRWS